MSLNSKISSLDLIFSIDNIFYESYYNYAVVSFNSQGVYYAYPEPDRLIYLSIGKYFNFIYSNVIFIYLFILWDLNNIVLLSFNRTPFFKLFFETVPINLL